MCERNPACFNAKKVIVDTNFISQINRTIIEKMLRTPRSTDEQREFFLQIISSLCEKLRNCGNGPFTSEQVYNDFDINIPTSPLRMDNTNFNALCWDSTFTTSLYDIYGRTINYQDLSDEEISNLQAILSDIGRSDVSLALLAIKLSQSEDVILITDDLALRNEIKRLIRSRTVAFSSNTWSTLNLHCTGSLFFLKNLHDCCSMSNGDWRITVLAFLKHLIERLSRELSDITYDQHQKEARAYMAKLSSDCRAKDEADLNRQAYRIFGETYE